MGNINKDTYENNDIETIVDSIGRLWLNEKNIEEKLGHKNLPAIANKYDQEYQKCRYELVNERKYQPNRRFLCSDLALKVIMDSRTDKSCNLKRNLGFKLHDVINTKEQTVLQSIKNAFEGEGMQTQYSVLGYKIYLYFHKYKLAIEVDELEHADRNLSNEIERQKALEKELDCVFIRINPNEKNFNIFREINKIHRRVKKLTKNLVVDDLSEQLLELKFKSNHSIKSRLLKWIVKNILSEYKK